MAFRFQPARMPAGDAPNVMNYPPDSAATYEKGAVVTIDGDGEVDEHGGGATTTGVRGVALEGVTSGSPDNPGDEAAVAVADRNVIFAGQVDNGGSVVTDIAGNITIGDQYGIVDVNGVWHVDLTDTSDVVLEVVDFDDDIDVVFFKFLEASLQAP